MFRSARSVVFLAMLLGTCFPASCSAQPGGGQGGYHEFTDSRGRVVQARVLRISGDKVTIERRDGKQFTVPISTFSQADQDFLRGSTGRKPQRATSDNWPRFRGPGGMGISDAGAVPLEWDADKNIAWKTELPGPGASSPITYGDRST